MITSHRLDLLWKKKIPPAHTDFQQFLGQPNTGSMFLNPTSPWEIHKLFGSFKNTAAGLDDISPKVVKSVITHISEPLCYILTCL